MVVRISRAETSSRASRLHGSVQEHLARGFEPIHELPREVIVGWVAGVQRRGESAFGADEVSEELDPPRERLPRSERVPEHVRSPTHSSISCCSTAMMRSERRGKCR